MKIIRGILSLFLAFLLVIPSVRITLSMHYCMGSLKSIAVFQEANSCLEMGMECPEDCCHDESKELKVQKLDFNLPSASLADHSSANQFFLTDSNQLTGIDPVFLRMLAIQWGSYKPPLIDRDIPILVHSLLI